MKEKDWFRQIDHNILDNPVLNVLVLKREVWIPRKSLNFLNQAVSHKIDYQEIYESTAFKTQTEFSSNAQFAISFKWTSLMIVIVQDCLGTACLKMRKLLWIQLERWSMIIMTWTMLWMAEKRISTLRQGINYIKGYVKVKILRSASIL